MSFVRTEIIDRVAVVTLDDPEHRNALRLEVADELVATVEQLEAADVGAMVVTGAGPAFCAGADLRVLQRAEGTEMVRVYKAFGRIYNSPLPSVAAVNGPAVGAGFNLALVCDIRLTCPSARFDTAFLRLAVHPGGGSTWLLERQLGRQALMALTVFQETLDGNDAERVGLAWRCLPDDQLLATAVGMARRAANHPPALAQKLRNTMVRMEDVTEYGAAVQIEMDEQLWSLRQPEAVAAIEARANQIGLAPDPAATPPADPTPPNAPIKLFKGD